MNVNGADSFPDAHLVTAKELKFSTPSPDRLSNDLGVFAEFFFDETAAPPTSPIATTALDVDLPVEDLPWSTWGAVADVLHTCVASVVQDLCAHVLLVQECIPPLTAVHTDADPPDQRASTE